MSLLIFNPSLCCLFIHSYVAVSRPCRLSEFFPNRVSLIYSFIYAGLFTKDVIPCFNFFLLAPSADSFIYAGLMQKM